MGKSWHGFQGVIRVDFGAETLQFGYRYLQHRFTSPVTSTARTTNDADNVTDLRYYHGTALQNSPPPAVAGSAPQPCFDDGCARYQSAIYIRRSQRHDTCDEARRLFVAG